MPIYIAVERHNYISTMVYYCYINVNVFYFTYRQL